MAVRVDCFSVSLDGYGAGPAQSLAAPMGQGGMALHQWALGTRTFRRDHPGMPGQDGPGTTGVDDDHIARGMDGIGAWILGRHMFGPSRGPWPDDGWRGWWGDEPPYRCPVFVLTRHARDDLAVGATTFRFVTGGLDAALPLARAAAGALDIRIGGGVATLRAALLARAVDRMHLAVAPVLLGRGEPLWPGIDLTALGYGAVQVEQGEGALHLHIAR